MPRTDETNSKTKLYGSSRGVWKRFMGMYLIFYSILMIFTVLLGLGERMINLFFALLLVFPVIVEANCADKLNVLECMKKEHD
ncbi:hypothetical protein TI05_03820, partial [Achromatium sp. WMS3]